MDVIALDLSLTGTGVVVNGSPRTIITKLKDEPRLDYILNEIVDQVDFVKPSLVIIEGLAFGSQTGKVAERGALHYMVRHFLWKKSIPFAIAPPTVVKAYLCGKGNAAKDEMMIAGARFFPEVRNNNENDAAVLYAMAMDKLGKPYIDVPKKNRDALAKVQWPDGI